MDHEEGDAPAPRSNRGTRGTAAPEQYGPEHSWYGPEEWIARDFFGDKRDGFFVDVGANHYKNTSNTYFWRRASTGRESRSNR